jgi:hypothetical protein
MWEISFTRFDTLGTNTKELFLKKGRESNLRQDHMNEQLGMEACMTTVNVGRDWLKGMGDAASELGFHVSYCMTEVTKRHSFLNLHI